MQNCQCIGDMTELERVSKKTKHTLDRAKNIFFSRLDFARSPDFSYPAHLADNSQSIAQCNCNRCKENRPQVRGDVKCKEEDGNHLNKYICHSKQACILYRPYYIVVFQKSFTNFPRALFFEALPFRWPLASSTGPPAPRRKPPRRRRPPQRRRRWLRSRGRWRIMWGAWRSSVGRWRLRQDDIHHTRYRYLWATTDETSFDSAVRPERPPATWKAGPLSQEALARWEVGTFGVVKDFWPLVKHPPCLPTRFEDIWSKENPPFNSSIWRCGWFFWWLFQGPRKVLCLPWGSSQTLANLAAVAWTFQKSGPSQTPGDVQMMISGGFGMVAFIHPQVEIRLCSRFSLVTIGIRWKSRLMAGKGEKWQKRRLWR